MLVPTISLRIVKHTQLGESRAHTLAHTGANAHVQSTVDAVATGLAEGVL